MFLYADPTACPRCRSTLPAGRTDCSQCRARLDDAAAYDVFVALQQVDRLVGRLAERPLADAATASQPTTPVAQAPAPPAAPPLASSTSPTTATAPAPARAVMSGLTVPKILLGLGALCLVVAALVFLVVAWASLGVGGRTAVLVGFTVVAAGLAAWSARAGLRAGAESMTTVALGLLLLDLAGAQGAGWFGDLDASGFLLLAGTTVVLVGAAATVATRRTAEPRLLSAEVAASCAMVAVLAGLEDVADVSVAAWAAGSLAITCVLAAAGWRLRLGVATWTAATLAGLSWLVLTGVGIGRAVAHPSWAGFLEDLRVWPLLLAALVAAAPAFAPRVPASLRGAGAAVAVLLGTGLVATPGLDEGPQAVALVLVGIVAAHAAASWRMPHPWRVVVVAPLTIAGAASVLTALLAALHAVADSDLLDHGLWTGAATGRIEAPAIDAVWGALMPLTAAAGAVAVVALARLAGAAPRLVAPASGAVVLALASLSPVLIGVPRHAAVASLVLVAAVLLGWGVSRRDVVAGLLGTGVACVALGGALADDGLTITVLALLTAALAAAGTQRAPEWLHEPTAWLLPASAAATTWAIASAADVSGGWRAVPVIVVVAALALGRPRAAHESVGLGAALVAVAVSAGFAPVDLRLVAAQLLALALLTTYVGVRRRPEASLVGLALAAVAAVTAWEQGPAAAIILAVALALTVLHEVRGVAPAAVVARAATPVALGALLWTVTGLGGASTVWQGVPVVVVLGALLAWRPDTVRELPAAVVATWAAGAALASLPDPQGWAAVYLTLGGVALTTSALLHPTRRWSAWGGLALLTLATWLRLEQLGVGTVEAYTLPLATVLLVVGTVALLRGDRSSLRTQGAGLGLALVPTLLQALAEPLALRAALLGIGCVVLIGVGVSRRWAAPLLAGGGTLALLVLRQVTIAQVLPQWALIACAGILLTFLGLTWEQRLANVRTAAGYVRGLH